MITEMKLMMVANLGQLCGLRSDDVVYTTLPLYHSAGLLIGVGGCFEVGMYRHVPRGPRQCREGGGGGAGKDRQREVLETDGRREKCVGRRWRKKGEGAVSVDG